MKIQFGKAFLRGLQLAFVKRLQRSIARKIAHPKVSTIENLRQTTFEVGIERVGVRAAAPEEHRFAQQQQGLPHDEAFTQAIAEYTGK